MIPLSDITPDENQPRKLFAPEKLATLKDSVKNLGVMSPITVEKVGNRYLIVDGERRYRVSKDLGLKEIPAIIIEPQTLADRLIQQFHIQEQHEGWTSVEKAVAMYNLSKELGVSLAKIAELLALERRVAKMYTSFAEIVDKKTWIRNEVGIAWAEPIKGLKEQVKKIYKNKLDTPFTTDDERKLERGVLERLKNGSIVNRFDLTKIKDSFATDPKSIEKFMSSNISPVALFEQSKAKGAYHIRNVKNHCIHLISNGRRFLENPDATIDKKTFGEMKTAQKVLADVISKCNPEE